MKTNLGKISILAAGLLASATLSAALTSPAVAATDLGSEPSHFFTCLQLMFTDPAQHAAQCGPGHVVFVSGSTGTGCAPHLTDPDTGDKVCKLPETLDQ